MGFDIALSAAQAIFAALKCQQLIDICSILGYESQLNDLKMTVETVKAVLLDAETKADHLDFSHQTQLFIEELKDAVYDADDLLDMFVTKAERKHKELLEHKEGSSKVPEKLCLFFSPIKNIPASYKMSHGVKRIRKKLDAIADNHNKFGFKIDSQPIRKRREETCSYVYSQDVIGRDADKEKIVGMLLDPNVRADASFLTIVGIGGLGKTTLAQLVYNEERITKEFPTRLWVCVSDEDPIHLDVKAILVKILGSTGADGRENTKEWLQCQVRKLLAENKYLLILDDIWNENRIEWLELENFLKECQRGSWVLVTTRSSITASIVGDGSSYELKGLSDEDSLKLFEWAAFGQTDRGRANSPDKAEISKKIVKKCANVPLALRVVGSLLYGQSEDKWSSFEQNGLTEVGPMKSNLFSVLEFSYHQLDSSLKSCFSYCSLFPKDDRIYKKKLIQLWLAQSFIVPLQKNQSIEDAAEEHFLILLRRCFFQDVKKDEHGEIISFKCHDLMHDVARKVSKMEVCSVDCITSGLDKKIRHVSVINYKEGIQAYSYKSKVRTLLFLKNLNVSIPAGPLVDNLTSLICLKHLNLSIPVGPLVDNWTSLRALDLSDLSITSLPDKIGNLLHLRYLDLSRSNKMEMLPESFTKLYNMETLILQDCLSLRELPTDFCKLVKLRYLDIGGCDVITDMPAGMGKLSCLHELKEFVVNSRNPDCVNKLESFRLLRKLKGHIEIRICCENGKYEKENYSELKGGYLVNKQYLSSIDFNVTWISDEKLALMEVMQPHPDLKMFRLKYYEGRRLPSWARGDNLSASLPNLVEIAIWECGELENLAPLGKLPHLRTLRLEGLRRLEYMENRNSTGMGGREGGGVDDSLFFPSLQLLVMNNLKRMKGWWREEEDHSNSRRESQVLPVFPLVSKLKIHDCPELAIIITVPNVEHVKLQHVNDMLRLRGATEAATNMDEEEKQRGREVETDNAGCITSLPFITKLIISNDNQVKRLEQVGDCWPRCYSSSLHMLEIKRCPNLTLSMSDEEALPPFLPSLSSLSISYCFSIETLPKWMTHLTALHHLTIEYCPNLRLTHQSYPPLFPPTLCSLSLFDLPQLEKLPEWMQHLTCLHSLYINNCRAIETVPQWMPLLTSLTQLKIMCSSWDLILRCSQSPPGSDWPNIRHIPYIQISQPLPIRSLSQISPTSRT